MRPSAAVPPGRARGEPIVPFGQGCTSLTVMAAQEGRRTAAAIRRRQREAEILAATRDLFDARGASDAQIEDIARAVNTNRAIIYRHFSGKDEIFALTLVSYLDQLRDGLSEAAATSEDPVESLHAVVERFTDYCVSYPAFVDCALSLMRRTGPELLDEISESALLRLGTSIGSCLGVLSKSLDTGVEAGVFDIDDTTLLANHMYASALGAMQLARVGMLIKEASPGVPTIARVSSEQVKRYLLATTDALVRR